MRCLSLVFFISIFLPFANAQVVSVDFLKELNLTVNAAGPYLLLMDVERNLLLAANANSSSLTVIDGKSHSIKNIPLPGRGYQHLKDESFTYNRITGEVWLLGKQTLFYVDPKTGKSKAFDTAVQFESIAVDEVMGTAYLSGRENGSIVGVDPAAGSRSVYDWKTHSEPLINMNQTPPPPIRKVVVDNKLGKLIALDGFSASLSLFSLPQMTLEWERKLNLPKAARWHYGGYDERSHTLYVVVETAGREAVYAAALSVDGGDDVIVPLPKLREAVGVLYNDQFEELYITYDNDPVLHIIDFKNDGLLTETAIPHYGNDALSLSKTENLLFIASWAFGEIEIVDLEARSFVGRISDLGILPHMFTMTYNPHNGYLYFPRGATAVNGVFGSSITALEIAESNRSEIFTGFSPVELVQVPGKEDFLVLGLEDQLSIVQPDGEKQTIKLPFDYPHLAREFKDGKFYVSYGPHQSYYPSVYIWGAKNGVMLIDPKSLAMNDRRIPRLAQDMCVDDDGALYLLQNNWGKEKLNILKLEDEVREFTPGRRIIIDEEVTRETTQREIICGEDFLYLMKTGESDESPGEVLVIDKTLRTLSKRYETGINPVQMLLHKDAIYTADFSSHSVTIIERGTDSIRHITGFDQPLSLASTGNIVWALEHGSGKITGLLINDELVSYNLPDPCTPNTMKAFGDSVIIAAHSADKFYLYKFDAFHRDFKTLMTYDYPYGDVSFDTDNSAFYMTGQFGDMIFELNKIAMDAEGRIWVTDFLSGKLFIVQM